MKRFARCCFPIGVLLASVALTFAPHSWVHAVRWIVLIESAALLGLSLVVYSAHSLLSWGGAVPKVPTHIMAIAGSYAGLIVTAGATMIWLIGLKVPFIPFGAPWLAPILTWGLWGMWHLKNDERVRMSDLTAPGIVTQTEKEMLLKQRDQKWAEFEARLERLERGR